MGSGVRYGLLAALTLVIACGILWDRMHPATGGRLAPRTSAPGRDLARFVFGGPPPAPPPRAAPPASPAGPRAAPAASPMPPAQEPGVPGAPGAPAPGPRTHTVVAGDTLGVLALRYLGTSRRAADLARANGIALQTPLRVGMVLRIPEARTEAPTAPAAAAADAGAPPPAAEASSTAAGATAGIAPPRQHRVAGGDTLTGIARRYYGSAGAYRRLCEANSIPADAVLRPGQVLTVP